MKIKKFFWIGLILILGFLFLGGLASAEGYMRSNPKYTNAYGGWVFEPDISDIYTQSFCEQGQEFIIQIAPFGCTPAVVRSDLLEEQNVPVFCQLAATKINPLIDVDAIESISFKGQYPKIVSDIGFQPARAALGVKGDLNSPFLNNIGYVIVVLGKQKNESFMPDFVEGDLTATIKYDLKKSMGIGDARFYMPELDEADWQERASQYSFWDGKGYIQANYIGEEEASFSVYDSNKRKVETLVLEKGETSNKVYLPGFYCLAGLNVKFNGLENPETRAKFKIDSDIVEAKDEEKFLDNKCSVTNIDKKGLVQEVQVSCYEDEGKSKFSLRISPEIVVNLIKEGKTIVKNVSVGDQLYTLNPEDTDTKYVYVGYIGETENGLPFMIPVVSPAKTSEEFKKTLVYNQLPIQVKALGVKTGNSAIDLLFQNYIGGIDLAANIFTFVATGGYPVQWSFIEDEDYTKKERKFEKGTWGKILDVFDRDASWFGKAVNFVGALSSIKDRLTSAGKEFIKEQLVKYIFLDGLEIKFVSFAGPKDEWDIEDIRDTDSQESKELRTYLKNAFIDYDEVIEHFALEKENPELENEETLGERALYEKIVLAYDIRQKKTMLDLCKKFSENYPDSVLDDNEKICDDDYKLSNTEQSVRHVFINGEVRRISFEGIYEPSYEDLGVEVYYSGGDKENFVNVAGVKMTKGMKLNLVGKNDYVELVDVYEDSARFEFHVMETSADKASRAFSIGTTHVIKKGEFVTNVGENNYKFGVSNINLKKVARVTIDPDIDAKKSEADFKFKVGIEKRDIKLNPSKIKEKIKNLNETIEKWEGRSEKLGNVVKGLKAACLATGSVLTVKNLFTNLGGKAIARQKVMRSEGGWYDVCEKLTADGKYKTRSECLSKEADNIDKDVDAVFNVMKTQQEDIKRVQEGSGAVETQFLERVVNDQKFMAEYVPQVQSSLDSLGSELINPSNPSQKIDIAKIKNSISYDKWNKLGTFDISQTRDIELYTKILDSNPSPELEKVAKQELYNIFSEINEKSASYELRESEETKLKEIGYTGSFNVYSDEKTIQGVYTGGTISGSELLAKSLDKIDSVAVEKDTNYPIEVLRYQSKNYAFVLSGDAPTYYPVAAYEYLGTEGRKIELGKQKDELVNNFIFKKYDKSSYKNKYENPVLRYHETEPYKGLPAIVPFDLDNGWYAATTPTIPIGGAIQPYDASGRVASFWLCNVGQNGLEQFKSGGDDICQLINLGTRQTYTSFYGLDENEVLKLVDRAVEAIRKYSRAYKAGLSSVIIDGRVVKVGEPYADIPDIECQDIMSPNDCKILFNVCDPVICPSSRCNLGGTYHVKDVIQSGIIGGIALCLPNFREGILIPVCLSGIKAGIDGLLSVYKEYQGCLQKNLETGEMVGICDEIYSIHLCEFFWRQSIPLAKIAVPSLLKVVTGQYVHGGGEYMGVQSAWDNAQKSVTYFTQYYAQNSYNAFKARSTEDVGGEICNNFVSGVYPEGGNILDALTDPDSPPQFHGWFDEIPFTSATSPPISHYKVFYHIYAGEDSRAYYSVYLSDPPSSSFYQDTDMNRAVGSGYLGKGETASETKDFTAPAGYSKLCINVNGQEECGFKQVSTSFAVDYMKDMYMKSEAERTDINSETECIAGTASAYSLLNPNVQEGVSEMINPEIYNRGVIRICATDDPGKGTDAKTGTDESRWKPVGYCDKSRNIRCWVDTDSIKDVIQSTKLEGDTLEELTENQKKILENYHNYLSSQEFGQRLKEIKDEKDNLRKIEIINALIDRVFMNREKGILFFYRGNAYGELAVDIFERHFQPEGTTITSGEIDCETYGGVIKTSCAQPECEVVMTEDWYSSNLKKFCCDVGCEERKELPEETQRGKWTLDSAIEEARTLRGKYSDNQDFFDQLHEDNILSNTEWDDANGILGLSEWSVNELLTELLQKKAKLEREKQEAEAGTGCQTNEDCESGNCVYKPEESLKEESEKVKSCQPEGLYVLDKGEMSDDRLKCKSGRWMQPGSMYFVCCPTLDLSCKEFSEWEKSYGDIPILKNCGFDVKCEGSVGNYVEKS